MAFRTARLVSTALDGVPFDLRSIERAEEHHGLYRFDVELAITDRSALRACTPLLVRSRVMLLFEEGGIEVSRVHGLIVAQWQHHRMDRVVVPLYLTIRPRVWAMTSTRATETFQALTVPEILTRKLRSAGLEEGEDFVFILAAAPRVRGLVVQHGEDDFDFLCRLCDDAGLRLSFEHREDREVLVFSDRANPHD